MDGKEATELTEPVPETQPELHVPPGFPPVPYLVLPVESSVGGGSVGVVSANGVNGTSTPSGDPLKRGRGRPRKANSLGKGGPRKIEQDDLSPMSPTSPLLSSLTPTQKNGTESPQGTGTTHQPASLEKPSGERVKRNRSRPRRYESPAPSSLTPTQKQVTGSPPRTAKMEQLDSHEEPLKSSRRKKNKTDEAASLGSSPVSSTTPVPSSLVPSRKRGRHCRSGTGKTQQLRSLGALVASNGDMTGVQSRVLEEKAADAPTSSTDISVKEISLSTDAKMFKTSADEVNLDSEPSLEVVGNVPPEFKVVYEKIAARHGRLDIYLPGYLPQTYDALTKELLETIAVMMQTKPSELSIVAISQWESIVKFAADAKFNVGWLSDILAKMWEFVSADGVTVEQVEQQVDLVENLKKEVAAASERLDLARQVVEVLEKEACDTSSRLEVACSELETLKGRKVFTSFFGYLK